MSCSRDDLKSYLLGELSEPERRLLENHLDLCSDCGDELEKLRSTQAALRSLPQEEPPHRIAFVSDKIFKPKGWAWLWNSAPRLGFVSAAVLAAAILVHAFVRPAPSRDRRCNPSGRSPGSLCPSWSLFAWTSEWRS